MSEHGTKTSLNSEYILGKKRTFKMLCKKFLIWILFQDLKKKKSLKIKSSLSCCYFQAKQFIMQCLSDACKIYLLWFYWASFIAQSVKSLPPMQETWVRSLSQEDPLQKEMETHSSILAWRIPSTEEPGRQSVGIDSLWGCKSQTQLGTHKSSTWFYSFKFARQNRIGKYTRPY